MQLSNKDLKKLVSEYILLEDIYDQCEKCGRPIILHQQPDEECTREVDEGLDVIIKVLDTSQETPSTNSEGDIGREITGKRTKCLP